MDWENIHKNKKGSGDIEKFFDNLFNRPKSLAGLIIAALIVIGVYSSWYTVQTDERALVLRFGKYNRSTDPGLQFKLPYGIEKAIKVKTTIILEEAFGFSLPSAQSEIVTSGFTRQYDPWKRSSRNFKEESIMLTGDLNVAEVEWVVQYRVANPNDYLFKVRDPEKNIRDISQAIMRRVVGDRTVNEVLTVGRVEIAAEAKQLTQEILENYEMGVQIVDIKLQDINPPDRVKKSFNDVVAAKQEQERLINIAEKEYNSIIPEARGKAEQSVSQAKGYSAAVVNRAKGDAEKFSFLLAEYRKAPEVTRTRLYFDVVQKLLKRLKHVTIVDPDVKGVLPVFGTEASPLTGTAAGKQGGQK